jgi:C4-dicarboxylate-specific signal transduction histidine kinase
LTERMKRNFAELSTTSKFVALGEMAAGIAHEINNPLTVIMGKASLLEKAGEHVDANLVHESSIKIIEMVHRITRTVHALRVYARSGETDPVGVESVESIINSTLDVCLERLRLASIRIDVSIEPTDAMIIARPVQISQILMNLLNNAHDAIMAADRAGEISSSDKWIRLTAKETATHVLIAVENGGPRIPQGVAQRLFEPFFTTKPSGVGTGLGLMISRRLAHVNGSDLQFDISSPITRFELTFPRPDLELLQPVLN